MSVLHPPSEDIVHCEQADELVAFHHHKPALVVAAYQAAACRTDRASLTLTAGMVAAS